MKSGRLQSMEWESVKHSWATNTFTLYTDPVAQQTLNDVISFPKIGFIQTDKKNEGKNLWKWKNR